MSNVEYISNSVRRSKNPILNVTKTFYGKDTEPCILENFELQDWYHGTGISPDKHPGRKILRVLDNYLPEAECGYCKSKNVLVLSSVLLTPNFVAITTFFHLLPIPLAKILSAVPSP